MQDSPASRPMPLLCPWCSSTNTITAQRCIICGMDLGRELRAVQQSGSAVPVRLQWPPHRFAWQALGLLMIVVLAALILGVLWRYIH